MKRLLVPDNLNLDDLLKQYPRCDGFKKDKVYYVCHAICSESTQINPVSRCHELKKEPYFVPLRSKILERFLGTEYYKPMLKWMCDAGIIEMDNSWKDGFVSRGYRFTPAYRDTKRSFIEVKDSLISKKLSQPFNNEYAVESSKDVQGLFKWFNGLQIDHVNATTAANRAYENEMEQANKLHESVNKHLVYAAEQRRTSARLLIEEISSGSINKPFQDTTGRRLHSVITKLPKILRPYVTYEGQPLSQVDLSNSLLYCTLYLLNKDNWNKKNSIADVIWDDLLKISNKYNRLSSFLFQYVLGNKFFL